MPNIAINADCLEAMRQYPDNYFDLAVCDPPYGGGDYKGAIVGRFGGHFEKYNLSGEDEPHRGGDSDSGPEIIAERDGRGWAKKYGNEIRTWDVAPPPEYFTELARVSKNQVIWGGNYFNLPPTRCFLIWRKLTISESFTMAMCEYAWTSFNDNAKLFEYPPQDPARFHPTQKPVALYAWIYRLYAKPGFKILDTHLGSGSSRIAAYDAGLDFTGYEISKYYFDLQEERYNKHTAQFNLFLD